MKHRLYPFVKHGALFAMVYMLLKAVFILMLWHGRGNVYDIMRGITSPFLCGYSSVITSDVILMFQAALMTLDIRQADVQRITVPGLKHAVLDLPSIMRLTPGKGVILVGGYALACFFLLSGC